MEPTDYIFGFRAVIEAIEAGRDIDKILLSADSRSDQTRELLDRAKQAKVMVQRVPPEKINRITRKNHQGVLAFLSAVTYHRLEHLVPELYEAGMLPFVVVLDGVTDVRNFGAIARTCECAGVDAIVIPMHGSVTVGGDAVKTSAGALLHLPVCRERNVPYALQFLKDNGYTIVGVTEKASVNYTQTDVYSSPVALVLGSEEKGISTDALRLCDVKTAIPMFGKIESLNVSVAAGVLIYEVVRQRLNSDIQVQEKI